MTMYNITIRFGDLEAATRAILHIAAEFPGFDVSFGPDYVEVAERQHPVTISDKARRNVSAANRRPSARVLDTIEHTSDIWMTTPCSYCQQRPGRPCVTPSGRDTFTHGDRATAWRRSLHFDCLTCDARFATGDALEWHITTKHAAVPAGDDYVIDVQPSLPEWAEQRIVLDEMQ